MRRAALVVLALALAGCGGPPTHDEFVARANEVCDRHVGRLMNIAREGTSRAPLSEDERHTWEKAYFDAYGDMVAALTDLDRPRADPAVDRYLARLEEIAEDVKDGSFDSGDLSPDSRTLAEAAGLQACSPG